MLELVYFMICFAATVLGAISGIGGGVLIKPVMDALSPFSVPVINFLSGCTVFVMAAVSMILSRRGETRLEPRRGTLLALGGVAGGMLGKAAFGLVREAAGNEALVGMWQNLLLLLMTLLVFAYYLRKHRMKRLNGQSPALCVGAGLGLGVVSTFLGIGGGPINLMVLSLLFAMETKAAALHSLYIILLSQTASLLTTLFSGTVPAFPREALALMALGGVLGSTLGRFFSRRMSGRAVEVLFQIILVLILGVCLYNILRFSRG